MYLKLKIMKTYFAAILKLFPEYTPLPSYNKPYESPDN